MKDVGKHEHDLADGYFKVARAIARSSLVTMRPEDFKVAVMLMGLVNWTERKWFDRAQKKDVILEPGELITSRKHLAEDCNMTQRQIRTALDNLVSSGFLTKKATKQYTLIKLIKYEYYQDSESYGRQRPTNVRPATDQAPTIDRPLLKKDNKDNIERRTPLPPSLDTEEFKQAWGLWVRHRREINKKLTPTAVERLWVRLEKWGVVRAIAAIELSVAQGWQSIYEEGGKGGSVSRSPGKGTNRSFSAARTEEHRRKFDGY